MSPNSTVSVLSESYSSYSSSFGFPQYFITIESKSNPSSSGSVLRRLSYSSSIRFWVFSQKFTISSSFSVISSAIIMYAPDSRYFLLRISHIQQHVNKIRPRILCISHVSAQVWCVCITLSCCKISPFGYVPRLNFSSSLTISALVR